MKVFLSYSWKNEKIADSLDILFKTKNITLERDVRGIQYKQSIKAFMQQVRKSDYCLVVISKPYLESINCMYEVMEFIKDDSYRDRILPLVSHDSNIFSAAGRSCYIKFWQDEFNKLNDQVSCLEDLNRMEAIQELKRIENIKRNIGEFLSVISDMNVVTFDSEIDNSSFQKIYGYISGEIYESVKFDGLDGYFLANIPRTMKCNSFVWWGKESKGYTKNLDEAKVFTQAEIDEKLSERTESVEWWSKKFTAVPINKLAAKFGQIYIPYDQHFLDIFLDNKDLLLGNKQCYLSEEDVLKYG